MDLPFLERSIGAPTATGNQRASDFAVGPMRKPCRSRVTPAWPQPFLRRKNAMNIAHDSGMRCGCLLRVSGATGVGGREVEMVRIGKRGGAKPIRLAGSAPSAGG